MLTCFAGRYRNIPQYITLSFIALAEVAGLAPAASLYFLTLAVTHEPLIPAAESDKTRLLTSHPVLLLTPALLAFIWIFYLPGLLESSIWTSLSSLGYFIVPLLLAMLAQPNYLHQTAEHVNTASARLSYTAVFRILGWASLAIHAYRSAFAVYETAPPRQELLHNHVWMLHSWDSHSVFDQAFIALSKILGALHDNPIVSSTGWDVLLTEFGFCAWAVTRGLDPRAILRSAGLLWSKETSAALEDRASNAANAVTSRANAVGSHVTDSANTVAKKASAATNKVAETATIATNTITDKLTAATNAIARKASKPAKQVRPSTPSTTTDDDDDSTPLRTVEDEFEELIHSAEAEADTGAGHELRRSTRRPRKSNASTAPSSPRTAASKRKQQQQQQDDELDDEDNDRAYNPTPATKRDVQSLGVLAEVDDSSVEAGEAGALAWGLFVLGGLGLAGAGVLGAEVGGGR